MYELYGCSVVQGDNWYSRSCTTQAPAMSGRPMEVHMSSPTGDSEYDYTMPAQPIENWWKQYAVLYTPTMTEHSNMDAPTPMEPRERLH